jgi:hypothetical protein
MKAAHTEGRKEDISNLGLLAGPDGYLLVDHPEPTSGPKSGGRWTSLPSSAASSRCA